MPPMSFTGVVIRTARMDKTVTVTVRRQQLHKRTGKLVVKAKNFLVHDERNQLLIDDTVLIRNCPPISKRKRFTLESIVESPERDARIRHENLVKAAAREAAEREAAARAEATGAASMGEDLKSHLGRKVREGAAEAALKDESLQAASLTTLSAA